MSGAHRPHLAIPLSPPSPPAEGVKEGLKAIVSDYTPRSPASPYMSVATKSYGPSFSGTQTSSGPTVAQRSPSPPISAPMSTQVSQQPREAAVTQFSTPENNVIGNIRKVPDEFDEGHISKRQKTDNETMNEDGDASHQRSSPVHVSEHAKILTPSSFQQLGGRGDESIARSEPLPGEELATHPQPDAASLERLPKNADEVFHLCKSAVPRIRPDPRQHLLSCYGLSGLHAKVARTDPITHEKINKLRKSYEGQIKNFALAGRNKPTKEEIPEGQWSSLNMMMLEPDDSWYASKVMGKKIEVNSDLESRLRKAMFLQPGRTRDHEQWEDLLGHEKARPVQAQEPVSKKVVAGAPLQRPQVNGSGVRTLSHAAGDAMRPRRTGKKRSYADNSFEGYGDGFVDDEAVDRDHSFLSNSEDGSHGLGRKKRKKDHLQSSSATMYAAPPSSYGVGGWNGGDR